MRRLTAAGAATALTIISLTTAPAASAQPVQVPCDPAALAAAVTSTPDGGTVSLTPSCTYLLTVPLPAVTRSLTIDGNGATLRRSAAPGTPRFVILTDTGPLLTVNGLSFANGDLAITQAGAGLLFVNGGTFTGNQGGAISMADTAIDPDLGNPAITGAVFTRNTGTAVSFESVAGALTVTRCVFTGNTGGDGGALWISALYDIVTGTVITGNHASGDGGGIWADNVDDQALTGDTITRNTAGGDGGGVYTAAGSDPTDLTRDLISGNQARGQGGGVWDGSYSFYAAVKDTVITGNTAGTDGGGYADAGEGSAFTGSQVYGNQSGGDGGGLWEGGDPFFGNLALDSTPVAGNQAAGRGGGIFNDAGITATAGSRVTRNTGLGGGGGIFDVSAGDGGLVSLGGAPVTVNQPDNCEPAGTITGCTG